MPAGIGSRDALGPRSRSESFEPSDCANPLDQNAQPLAEGPHALWWWRRLAALRGGASAFFRGAHEAADQAPGLAFHDGQARECRGDAELGRVAAVDAGHERIGEDVGGLLAGAARHEGGDRFIHGDVVGRFRQSSPSSCHLPRIDRSGEVEQAEWTAGQPAELAAEEEVSVLAASFAGGDQAAGKAEVANEIGNGGSAIEKAVRAALDAKAVVILGTDVSAWSIARFEDRDCRGWGKLLEAKGDR